MLSKMISIHNCGGDPINEEIQILLKSLKPGKKLPLLIYYCYPESYPEQLIVENYLNGLLEGYTLEFMTTRSLKEIGGALYLTMNKRLLSIFMVMIHVINRRVLTLNLNVTLKKDYYFITTNHVTMMNTMDAQNVTMMKTMDVQKLSIRMMNG